MLHYYLSSIIVLRYGVLGNLPKPVVRGQNDVEVGSLVTLTCNVRPSDNPANFTWYKNETKIGGQTANQMSFIVTKNDRYDNITCAYKRQLDSYHSDIFRINPLYGPDRTSVMITPNNGTYIEVKEGETFGPYKCLADCNPPCKYQWLRCMRYRRMPRFRRFLYRKYTERGFANRYNWKRCISGKYKRLRGWGPQFEIGSVDRIDAGGYRCKVKWPSQKEVVYKDLFLNVMYVSEPVVYINDRMLVGTIAETTQRNSVKIDCMVTGKPMPVVSIYRQIDMETLGTPRKTWSNYTFPQTLQCSDAGLYKCVGQSRGGINKERSFTINIRCDVMTVGSVIGITAGLLFVMVSVVCLIIFVKQRRGVCQNVREQRQVVKWKSENADVSCHLSTTNNFAIGYNDYQQKSCFEKPGHDVQQTHTHNKIHQPDMVSGNQRTNLPEVEKSNQMCQEPEHQAIANEADTLRTRNAFIIYENELHDSEIVYQEIKEFDDDDGYTFLNDSKTCDNGYTSINDTSKAYDDALKENTYEELKGDEKFILLEGDVSSLHD